MYVRYGKHIAFVSPQGGCVTGWQYGDTDVFFPRRFLDDKLRGGLHPCFPFFGQGSKFKPMPHHGFLRDTLMNVQHFGSNRVQFEFSGPPLRYQSSYPWRHSALVEVAATVKGLIYTAEITNLTTENEPAMPVNFGQHPYFNAPHGFLILANCNEPEAVAAPGGFGQIWAEEVTVVLYGIGQVVICPAFEVDEKVELGSYFVFWTDRDDRYVCIEPVWEKPGDEVGRLIGNGQTVKTWCSYEFEPAPSFLPIE